MLKKLFANQIFILLSLQIGGISLVIFNILNRKTIFFIDGILLSFFIFAPLYDAIVLFIASIPLFTVLPLFEIGGSTSFWRIAIFILFLRTFKFIGFKKTCEETKKFLNIKENWKEYRLYYVTILFLIWTIISLWNALSITTGLKKTLFLINIIALFYIIKKSDILKIYKEKVRLMKSAVFSVGFVLIVGLIQILSTIFMHLYNFWQFWAKKVIPLFYGENLAKVLTTANTWFSYYPDKPPTLRMFSVFPDSHSFALFVMIGMIFVFFYIISSGKFLTNKLTVLFLIFSLFGIIFSGSRGIWISLFGTLIFAISYFLITKQYKENFIFKILITTTLIFVFLFPITSIIYSFSKDVTYNIDTEITLKRLKSIANLEEISNKSRLDIWLRSVKSIINKPVLGVGYGNYPVILKEDLKLAKYGSSAHNLYLDVASETGLIGLLFLLGIFWEIFIKAYKSNNNFSKSFLICFLAILWYNIFDVVLLNDKVLLFFMVPLALLYSDK